MIIINIVLLILFGYLCFCTIYTLIFAVASRLKTRTHYSSSGNKNSFAILIPAYKEDRIILETVKQILQQDYRVDKFEVIVIADQLKEGTLLQLSMLPVRVIQVSFKRSTKAKSIKFALQRLGDIYQCILVLDADNFLGEGCLEKANHAYSTGFKMIQLHRTAKNKNTPTAILDAISEEMGNAIHRKGHRRLGLSATLIGSGMVFDYQLFKSLMLEIDVEDDPAEDRAINSELLKKGFICEYIEDAYVYDEKVQSNWILERQRIRWISAQLNYFERFWFRDLKKTLSGNSHYIDYALQTLIIPRSTLLVSNTMSFGICLSLWLALDIKLFPGIIYWVLLFMTTLISIGFAIGGLGKVTIRDLGKAVLYFPVTFWSLTKAGLKSSSSQKEFIHTTKEFSDRGELRVGKTNL